MEKLGKITQKQSDFTLVDSINEMATLGDGTQILIDDFYEIKEALTNRHLIMRLIKQKLKPMQNMFRQIK